jgi:hypothetical protein
MVDFTRYEPPGIYVEDATTPVVAISGAAPSVVALVGPAQGYQNHVETVSVLAASNANSGTTAFTTLAEQGIYSAVNHVNGINDMVVTLLDGTVLLQGSGAGTAYDYRLAYDATSLLTTIQLNAGGPGVGSNTSLTVVASYAYTAPNYFDPLHATDFQTVEDTFGPALIGSAPTVGGSQVVSALSLAAKVAFENGATELVCVPLDPTAGDLSLHAQLTHATKGALPKLLADDAVSIVVPILPGAPADVESYKALIEDVRAHCVAATADGNPRIAIAGLRAAVTLSAAANGQGAAKYLAADLDSSRMVVAYPESLGLYNGANNTTATVDGIYLAAAYAGRFQALPFQKALTKESIRSFNGIPASIQRVMTKSNKNALSAAGVAVAEIDRQGNLSVRHGVATDMSSVLTREVSITRARDALSTLLASGLEASGLIGDAITVDTPVVVQSAVTGILENAKATGLIVDYSGLAVREQVAPQGDPTVIEVKFAYKPAFPLNYIVVSFSIDLSSGTVLGIAV